MNIKEFWNSSNRKDKTSFVIYCISMILMLTSILLFFINGRMFLSILIFALGFGLFEIYDYNIYYKFKLLKRLE